MDAQAGDEVHSGDPYISYHAVDDDPALTIHVKPRKLTWRELASLVLPSVSLLSLSLLRFGGDAGPAGFIRDLDDITFGLLLLIVPLSWIHWRQYLSWVRSGSITLVARANSLEARTSLYPYFKQRIRYKEDKPIHVRVREEGIPRPWAIPWASLGHNDGRYVGTVLRVRMQDSHRGIVLPGIAKEHGQAIEDWLLKNTPAKRVPNLSF